MELRTGLHLQKRTIDAPVVHFGLGEATRAEVVRVVWPNGIIQSEFNTAADTTVAATQRLKGSCPWLFAWNGREMGFVTDLIWRSPLGLRINAQQTADVLMTEDWVKMRGDQLAPRGRRLRPARDRGAVGDALLRPALAAGRRPPARAPRCSWTSASPCPPPRLAVHVTGPGARAARGARRPRPRTSRTSCARATAATSTSRAAAPTRASRATTTSSWSCPTTRRGAGRSGWSGQGWVHPTDSSINVAIGQGAHARPRGLSLHVADAAGRFRKVRDGLGFPSGKDKTVLLDLTGVFPASGPRRLRLATNLEVFWDRLGWAEGRPDVRVTPASRRARRRPTCDYRGYSVTRAGRAQLARAAALRAGRHGAALAGPRGLPHALRRRARAAGAAWTTAT